MITPDPKRVMDFEEAAKQFGFSLGGAPARKFTFTNKRRDGRKGKQEFRNEDVENGHQYRRRAKDEYRIPHF